MATIRVRSYYLFGEIETISFGCGINKAERKKLNRAITFEKIDPEALSDCINHWHNFSEKLPPGYDIQLGLTLSKDSG